MFAYTLQTINYKSRIDIETKKRFTFWSCHSYVISEFWELENYSSRCGRTKDANNSRQLNSCDTRENWDMNVRKGNRSYTLNVLDFFIFATSSLIYSAVWKAVLYFFIFLAYFFVWRISANLLRIRNCESWILC